MRRRSLTPSASSSSILRVSERSHVLSLAISLTDLSQFGGQMRSLPRHSPAGRTGVRTESIKTRSCSRRSHSSSSTRSRRSTTRLSCSATGRLASAAFLVLVAAVRDAMRYIAAWSRGKHVVRAKIEQQEWIVLERL